MLSRTHPRTMANGSLACGQLRAACLPRERVAAPNIGTCEATVPVSQTFECFSG